MKKTTIALMLMPCFAISTEFYSVIGGSSEKYHYNDYSETITYTEWTNVGAERNCIFDKEESDLYYGKTYNQTKECDQDQTRTKTVTKTYRDGTVESEDFIENQTVNIETKTDIVGTHLELSCKDILNNDYSEGSGAYHINYNSNPLPVYCDMEHDGGGWTLVRRIHGNWGGFNDSLFGTQSYGTYQTDPVHSSTFGIVFNNISYNDMYLTTGDKQKWLITDKASVQNDWVSTTACGSPGIVYKSSTNPNGPAQTVGWCKRTVQPEDPWISIETHGYGGRNSVSDDMTHSMLYGEYYSGWDYYVSNLNGVSIYIR